jgi:tellurite resistance protein
MSDEHRNPSMPAEQQHGARTELDVGGGRYVTLPVVDELKRENEELRARDEKAQAVVRAARQVIKSGGFPALTDALAALDELVGTYEGGGQDR